MTPAAPQHARSRSRRSAGRATITDVARAAGVHSNTVSAVLNNRDYCYASQETRRRIVEAARELRYQPSALARGLSGQRTASLGMVITGYDHELVSRFVFGFEDMARRKSLFMMTAATYNDEKFEDRVIRHLVDRAVDGIAILPCERGEHAELRRLVERKFPVVILGGEGLGIEADSVRDDAREAGRIQARHLIERGCRKIWYESYAQHCGVNDRKIEGFRQAAAEAGVAVRQFDLQTGGYTVYAHDQTDFEHYRPFFRERAGEIDALACLGDTSAQAAVRIAVELGLRVPEDIAIMGNGGLSGSALGALPLSTVGFDAEAVGRRAFELLDQRLDGDADAPSRHIVINPRLVARASTLGRKESS